MINSTDIIIRTILNEEKLYLEGKQRFYRIYNITSIKYVDRLEPVVLYSREEYIYIQASRLEYAFNHIGISIDKVIDFFNKCGLKIL